MAEEALEAALAAAGAWAGGWGGRRASLALHELACGATAGGGRAEAAVAVAALVDDPRFRFVLF